MPNPPDEGGSDGGSDYASLFDGADGPRPIPESVRDQLEASLTGPLGGADRPRPIPASLRDRIERTLVPASVASRLDRRMRIAAVAAALALLAGTIAVLGQAGGRDGSSERALVREPVRTAPELGASTTSSTVPATATTADPTVVGVAGSTPVKLQTFSSCPELLQWAKAEAGPRVTEYGIGAMGGGGRDVGIARPAPADSGTPTAAAGGLATTDSPSSSTTNVQEAGVDEPDRVKTDGKRLYLSRYQSIVAIDVTGPTPVVGGTLEFSGNDSVRGLLLDGSTLVAIVDSYSEATTTRLLAIDTSTMQVVDERRVEGSLVDARMTGGRVHAVVVDSPEFDFTYPTDPSPQAAAAAKAANQRVIAESTAAEWVPNGVACDDVRHPPVYAGPTTTTLYTFAPRSPSSVSAASVLANSSMVYASQDSLYVATADYDAMVMAQNSEVAPPSLRTSIHRFSLGATPRYLASGSVDGYLLSQWAMSERNELLRVASTSGPPWRGEVPSTSSVTVLATQGDQLVPIGHVGGLGKGQQIQGVRFVDDVGFVVTFLRTDPLYTIDLSKPEAPRVRGALEVPGFSAYLHPVPPGTLLGIGPDGDDQGRRTGEAVSLYDISSLDNPTLRQRLALGGESSYSPVENDHRAFLWYPQDSLAALPIYDYGVNATYASILTVTTAGVGERGRVTHDKRVANYDTMPIDRLVVVGDRLYSFSYGGVLASDLATLDDRGFVELPVEPNQPIPVD